MTIDADKLWALLEHSTIPRDVRCAADGFSVQWQRLIDGQPMTVLQNVADAYSCNDAALIAAAVNALPELLAVYEAACVWRDMTPGGPSISTIVENLCDAIDATRGKR
jgi:hypothetical protein